MLTVAKVPPGCSANYDDGDLLQKELKFLKATKWDRLSDAIDLLGSSCGHIRII